MTTAHEYFAAIQRQGAAAFAGTDLASSHGPVARRVRRDRTVRAGVATFAGVGIAGAGTFGILQLRGADALAPAGGNAPSMTGTAGTTEIPLDGGEVPVGYDVVVTVESGERADTVIERLAEAYEAPVANARVAIDGQLPAEAGGNPEGWLGAGEHSIWIEPDSTADVPMSEQASSMVASTVQLLESNDVPRDQWQRVLTVASLVEIEAPNAADMPQVARVILNRVEMDMRLELDSTVRYALGQDDGAGPFTTGDERQVDSSYNTYVHPGLPPGPIGTPSAQAIEAAVNPADGDWLYFVTVNPDTGETLFAEDFAEHQKNVMVLQEWAQSNN